MFMLLSMHSKEVQHNGKLCDLTYKDLERMAYMQDQLDSYTPVYPDLKELDPKKTPANLGVSYRNTAFYITGHPLPYILPDKKSVSYPHYGAWEYAMTSDAAVEESFLTIKFKDAEGKERIVELDSEGTTVFHGKKIHHALIEIGTEKPENKTYFYEAALQRLYYKTFIENIYENARTGEKFSCKVSQERLDFPGFEERRIVYTFPSGFWPQMDPDLAVSYAGDYTMVSETKPVLYPTRVYSENNKIFMPFISEMTLKKDNKNVVFMVVAIKPELEVPYNSNAKRYNFPYFSDGLFVRQSKTAQQELWKELGGNRTEIVFEIPDTEVAVIPLDRKILQLHYVRS